MAQQFKQGDTVHVNNKMQQGYSFTLDAACGDFPIWFQPAFTPGEMLRLGVFEGVYMRDCAHEYPAEMFEFAMFSSHGPDAKGCNAFKTKSRNGLSFWEESGWIHKQDPRGWFEWYARYWMGRRTADDERQIRRWKNFGPRHAGTVKYRAKGDVSKALASRQGLLQWAHDPFPDFVPSFEETGMTRFIRIMIKG